MKLIALSDIHKSLAAAKAAAQRISTEYPNAVLVSGDISHGDLEEAASLLEALSTAGAPVFFVPGNMDSPKLADWSKGSIKSLHGHCESLEGYALVGLGGSVYTPFNTPLEFNEAELSQILSQAASGCSSVKLILVSHCPPRGIKLDETGMGVHAGSYSVRQFIESRKPVLVVSGHVHEAQGIDYLGATVIVNPGPAYAGNYAKIELHDKVQVTLSKFEV